MESRGAAAGRTLRGPRVAIASSTESEGAVREVDPNGKVVWEYTGVTNTGEAQRLANGNQN
jgi:hypothetical protein